MRSGRQNVAVFLRVVEDSSRPPHDAGHRVLVEVDRKARLLLQQYIEAADQRPAARHHDPAVHDVRGQLRWRDLERPPYGVHDLLDRLLHRFPNLARVYADDLRDTRDEVAALYLHLALFPDRGGGSDLNLDLLRRGLADEEVVILAHELHDRLVQLVAAGADRGVRNDARQGDHGDLRRATADVDHHVPGRRLDREPYAAGRGHRLRDHVDSLRPRCLRRIPHGPLLDLRDPRRYADAHLGLHAEQVAVDDRLQEEPQHLLGHVEVGDHPVLERAYGEDAVGRAAEHALRFEPDAFDFPRGLLDRDDGGLVEHDALPLHVDQRIGS